MQAALSKLPYVQEAGIRVGIARACTSARAEAPVRIRVNAARDPHDRLHVARFGGVAVDPIEEVKETVPIVLGLWG